MRPIHAVKIFGFVVIDASAQFAMKAPRLMKNKKIRQYFPEKY